MSTEREGKLAALTTFIQLRLDEFNGLSPGITQSHVIEVAGAVIAEGFGGGSVPLWMTVHELSPAIKLTAWYELDEDEPESEVDDTYPVLWLEQPIVAAQVSELLKTPASYRPERASHLMVWPQRGLCLRYSHKSRQPTLLFAFKQMEHSEFERSPMAQCS
ncbi:MAG: hypothetical protein ACFBSF_05025 [Leptolyngbyaceae cyanobacterium]